MAVVPGGRAPYAPSKTVQSVIERHRAVGLPKIDLDTLERIGVPESLRPRTLAALKTLDFYDENGQVTPEFDNLKRVPAAEFADHLGLLLRKAYAPVIEIIGDPPQAAPQAIEDAFRAFEPRSQLVRMVQLFVGLMTYAQIMDESAKRKPGPKRRIVRVARKPNEAAKPSKPDPASQRFNSVTPLPPPGGQSPPPASAEQRTVTLPSGATLVLNCSVPLLTLSATELSDVLTLIKAFDSLGEKKGAPNI